MKTKRERAVWSWRFFNIIGGARPDNNKTVEENSVRDNILKSTIPNFIYSEENRNYVTDMFFKGKILNPIIFDKTTITSAK
jgi:hypothetical protein